MQIPKEISVRTSLIFVVVSILLTSLVFYAFATTPSSTFYISSGIYPGAPSYTIWREGSYYFAKDRNGLVVSSGTNGSQVTLSVLTNNTKIKFAQGTFVFTTAIPVLNKENIYIEGEGRETTILKFNDNVAGFNFTGVVGTTREITLKDLTIVGKNAQLLCFSNIHDVWIQNVELIGGGKTSTTNHPDNATMAIINSYGYVIVGLLIWDGGAAYSGYQPRSNGLFVYTTGDLKMSHSVFTGCAWEGVHFSNSAGKMSLCEFNNNDRHGLVFDTCASIGVSDSTLAYNGWSGLLIADTLSYNHTGHIISGNQFQENGRLLAFDALQITGAVSVDNVTHPKIFGNSFWWNNGTAIGLYDNASDVTIVANSFMDNVLGDFTKTANVTDIYIFHNTGFVTEAIGSETNTTATTFVFNHGLSGTPTGVWASFSTTAITGWTWTATATQITITVTGTLPASMTVYYDTIYKP